MKREREKREDETVAAKRRCTNPVSAEAFDILTQKEDSASCGNSWCDLLVDSCGLSDCGSVALSGVPVVTDVPVVKPAQSTCVSSATMKS